MNELNPKTSLPLGVEDFRRLIKSENPPYAYMDKSLLIYELIMGGALVNIIPRPRRFGKTLNLSMLHHFLAVGGDFRLFDGLKISDYRDICSAHQCKYPVLHMDFKDVAGETFDEACSQLIEMLEGLAGSLNIRANGQMSDIDREDYNAILHLSEIPHETPEDRAKFHSKLKNAPYVLTQLLQNRYHKDVVVLMDEYDTPFEEARKHGYEKGMTSLLKGMYSKLLKSNSNLAFAVLTGCPQASEPSTYLGINNYKVWSGASNFIDEYFGFTEDEVKSLLDYYHLPESALLTLEWHNNLTCWRNRVCSPWALLNILDQHLSIPQ